MLTLRAGMHTNCCTMPCESTNTKAHKHILLHFQAGYNYQGAHQQGDHCRGLPNTVATDAAGLIAPANVTLPSRWCASLAPAIQQEPCQLGTEADSALRSVQMFNCAFHTASTTVTTQDMPLWLHADSGVRSPAVTTGDTAWGLPDASCHIWGSVMENVIVG